MNLLIASILTVNIASTDVINKSVEIYTSEVQNRVLSRLGKLESNNTYEAINRLRYAGKYQFGAARLEDLKYIKKGCYNRYKNTATFINSCLTGKDGFTGIGKYLIGKKLQESIATQSLDKSYKYLISTGYVPKRKSILAAYLMSAHLSGDRGAYLYLTKKEEREDANGTRTSRYYNEGLKLFDD